MALSKVLLFLLIVEAQVDASVDDCDEVRDEEENHDVHGLDEDSSYIEVVRDLYERVESLG